MDMNMDFAVLLRAVDGVVTFFLIGFLGYALARRKWFGDESVTLLSKLVTNVAIPSLLFYNIYTSFTREELIAMAPGVLPPLISITINMLLSWPLAKLIRSRAPGIFVVSFSFSNSINIGLPINLALFGEAGLPYVLLYFMGNTFLCWSVGNYLLATDGKEPGPGIDVFDSLKKIFSAPMLAFFLGAIAVVIQLPVPQVAANALRMIGNMNAPLVMISMGVAFYQMGFGKMKFDLEMFLIIVGRFVVSPLLIIALAHVFPMTPLMRNVFIIQASMPVMTNVAMLAIYHKGDVDYATRAVCLTTLLSIITIPLIMVLAEGMG